MSLFICSVSVQFSHEADDPTNPVVYFHFEKDQGWTNHGAQFVMEEMPFVDVRNYNIFVSHIKIKSSKNSLANIRGLYGRLVPILPVELI